MSLNSCLGNGSPGELRTSAFLLGINVKENRRTVVEVRDDLHRELRKLALLNDLRIYELTSAIIEDFLRDQEKVKALIKKLKIA